MKTLNIILQPLTGLVDHSHEWQPRFFSADHPDTYGALSDLISFNHVTFFYDTLQEQLIELFETKNPGSTITRTEIEQQVIEHLKGRDPTDYGTWVYYPWSKRLVHVLPEAEFRELRTNRNRNKITTEEQERLRGLKMGIVGLSVGQATAVTLAMEEVCGEFLLADFDHLSLSNMNRLRAGVHSIGVNKAVLTAREIFEINPYATVRLFPEGLTDENMDAFLRGNGLLDLLFEECDDLYIKVRLRERARAYGIPVLMETSDRGLFDSERFDREPDRPLFHGLAGRLEAEQLRHLDTYNKVPLVMRIIGADTISSRLAASLVEVDASLKTWPQLASAISLGAAINTDAARRIALGQFNKSDRFYVDLEQIVCDGAGTITTPVTDHTESSQVPEVVPDMVHVVRRGAMITDEQVHTLVTYGAMAPSGGNCQPWRFVFHRGLLRCIHDVERSKSFLDFQHRATYLTFGAVVENMTLVAEQMGLESYIELFPVPGDPTVICDMSFRELPGTARNSLLFEQIPQRVTNRKSSSRRPLEPKDAAALKEAAEARGARLHLIDNPHGLDAISNILGRGDRLRFLSKVMHQEMMHEIRWTPEEVERTRDGIDIKTLELTPTDLAGIRLTSSWRVMEFVAQFGGGRNLERPARKSIAAASAVGLLTVAGTAPEDYFNGGQAVQQVWLTATARGYAFQPMTAITYLFMRLEQGGGEGLSNDEIAELRVLRRRYGELFDISTSHGEVMLFRLARASTPTVRSLRCRIEDILLFEP